MTSRRIPIYLAALFLPALHAEEEKPAPFSLVEGKVKLESAAIDEASGLAVSPANPDFLWIVNDSGAGPEIHLAGTDGSDRGKITLKDTKNVDWEDLASFKLDGKSYLLVADAGDNNAKRESCFFYVVREPELPAAGKSLDLTVLPAWQIEFKYPDGPRDCESVAVDVEAEKIVFISKRTHPPEVYELPLRAPKKRGILTAFSVGRTEVKPPAAMILPYMDQPTGLDISADGSAAVVITYYGVFLFPRDPKQSWADVFARKPVGLGNHQLPQAESVAFSSDGKTIYAVSEGLNSPLRSFKKQKSE